MSGNEQDLGLDLDLHFLPAWAQQPAGFSKFADHEGERSDPRRDRGPGPRRDRDRRERPSGEGKGRPPGPRHERGPRPAPRPNLPPRPQAPPLPNVRVNFLPDERGVESLARQIRISGRAYPLFEIAFMILRKPERHNVRFETVKKPEGPAEFLYLCALDDTLWPSEAEAVQHVLDRHFSTFYQTDKTPADPPKGTYTFVAQCGMSGTVLGPPNYHDYQNKLRKLHAERFSRIPFDVFKSRVKIVKDEATVKKWIEDQSWKIDYLCLNVPDTVKLGTREEVDTHFRETHLANVVKPVEAHTLTGVASRALASSRLQGQLRYAWEEQMRFPLQVVNVLSRQFASQGLHFFKVNRTVTHVSVARPKYLDLDATPVSEGIRRIVEFIKTHPRCSRRDLIAAWTPPAPPVPSPAPEAEPAAVEPPPEVAAMSADLHWLIHEGHVIEFADGRLELAKPQPPRPARPQPAPAAASAAAAPPQTTAGESLPAETEVTEDEPKEVTSLEEPGVIEGQPVPDQISPSDDSGETDHLRTEVPS